MLCCSALRARGGGCSSSRPVEPAEPVSLGNVPSKQSQSAAEDAPLVGSRVRLHSLPEHSSFLEHELGVVKSHDGNNYEVELDNFSGLPKIPARFLKVAPDAAPQLDSGKAPQSKPTVAEAKAEHAAVKAGYTSVAEHKAAEAKATALKVVKAAVLATPSKAAADALLLRHKGSSGADH